MEIHKQTKAAVIRTASIYPDVIKYTVHEIWILRWVHSTPARPLRRAVSSLGAQLFLECVVNFWNSYPIERFTRKICVSKYDARMPQSCCFHRICELITRAKRAFNVSNPEETVNWLRWHGQNWRKINFEILRWRCWWSWYHALVRANWVDMHDFYGIPGSRKCDILTLVENLEWIIPNVRRTHPNITRIIKFIYLIFS